MPLHGDGSVQWRPLALIVNATMNLHIERLRRRPGYVREDMMVTAGSQCIALLGRGDDSIAAVEQLTGCFISVLKDQQKASGAAAASHGYLPGEVPVVIVGPTMGAVCQATRSTLAPQ